MILQTKYVLALCALIIVTGVSAIELARTALSSRPAPRTQAELILERLDARARLDTAESGELRVSDANGALGRLAATQVAGL